MNNEPEFEFIRAKTVAELKDICRINNVCGFSKLKKDELCDLLITYYKKNPEQLNKDLQTEEQSKQNNIVSPPHASPIYIQGPIQEVVKK